MKYFMFLFALFGSSLALSIGQREVCYTDLNICALIYTSTENKLDSLVMKQSDFDKVDEETKAEFRDDSVFIAGVADDRYEFLRKFNRSTVTEKSTDVLDVYAGISDESWSLFVDSAGCVAGVGVCAGGVVAALETGGLAMFWLRVGCVGAGIQCNSAMRSYGKWRNFQRKLREAEAEKTASAAGNAGGGGGVGGDESGGGMEPSLGSNGGSDPTTSGGGTWHCVDTVVTVSGDSNPRVETICGASN